MSNKDSLSSNVAHKFHQDYDVAAERALEAGDTELQAAAEKASEAYDLTGMMALAHGNNSDQYKAALDAAKTAANEYAAVVRGRK